MILTRVRKGSEVIVRFRDHSEGMQEPVICVARGKLISKGPKYVKLHAWTVEGEEANSNEENSTTFIVVTAAIIGYAIVSTEWIGEPPV